MVTANITTPHNPHPITLCVVYIPPNSSQSYLSDLTEYLNSLISTNPTIVMGDFNQPNIHWPTLSSSSQPGSLICDFVFQCNLSQLIQSPTHYKGNILDLVLTNSPSLISNVTVHPYRSFSIQSDHLVITFSIKSIPFARPHHQPSHYVYDHTKTDWDSLLSYLLDFDFSEFYLFNDIESAWVTLKNTINDATSRFTPKVLIRPHQRPKWFTPSIQHKLNRIHSLRKKIKSSSSPFSIAKLLQAESSLQKDMEQAKTIFEHNLVNNFAFCRDHRIFKYINSITSHNSIPGFVHFGNTKAYSDLHKASLFNEFSTPPLHPQIDRLINPLYLSPPMSTPSVMLTSHPRRCMKH